jgi:hypothetical protein
MYRGSRKHILDWTEQPDFIVQLLQTVQPVQVTLTEGSLWMPRGYRFPDEARLETFGPRFMAEDPAWQELRQWWLRHERGSNTPNWDLAIGCNIEDKPGLVLVEAKANKNELKTEGKSLGRGASTKSKENHNQIGIAISEARRSLCAIGIHNGIDRGTHYQLSNRIAFTWKLASLGIPTVLVYLGFLGDTGIENVAPQFTNHQDWTETFWAHANDIAPKAMFERRLEIGATPAWCLVRSRQVLEISPMASVDSE